eukprot:COSAG02_NODE_4828_length_4932_cov_37.882888_5_plen_175_part_00
MGLNESAEEEWIEQKQRRKAKRKELLKTGAIHKKMSKAMAATLTQQSLQRDYATLPVEQRQQLEREKQDAKQQWLHADSLAFKFWRATEKYLGLETLTVGGQETTNVGESCHRSSRIIMSNSSRNVASELRLSHIHLRLAYCACDTVNGDIHNGQKQVARLHRRRARLLQVAIH